MNYFGQLFLKKSAIGYGCLVLLGSVSVAGAAELELKHQVFSKGVEKIVQNIKDRSSSNNSDSSEKLVTSQQVFGPFVIAGEAVSNAAKTVWPYINGVFDVVKSLRTHILNWLGGLRSFFKSLADPVIFNKLFENLHLKFGNFVLFMVGGADGTRDQFIGLFSGSKKEKTLQAAQFLLGLGNDKNKNFRAKPNVFNFLLLSGLDNPKKVTGKFDRLSEAINKLFDRLKNQRGGPEGNVASAGGQESEADSTHVYELDVITTKEYLNVVEGTPEKLYNLAGTAEVLSKIQTGKDYTNHAKTVISAFGNFGPFSG